MVFFLLAVRLIAGANYGILHVKEKPMSPRVPQHNHGVNDLLY